MLQTPITGNLFAGNTASQPTKETESARINSSSHLINAETAPFTTGADQSYSSRQPQKLASQPQLLSYHKSNSSLGSASNKYRHSTQALQALYKAQSNQRANSYHSRSRSHSHRSHQDISQSPTSRQSVPSHIVKPVQPQIKGARKKSNGSQQLKSLSFQNTGRFKGDRMTI